MKNINNLYFKHVGSNAYQVGSYWIKLDQIGSNWIKMDQIGLENMVLTNMTWS